MADRSSAPTLKTPVNDADHVRGPADAPVTLLEYGDYQCPHCGRAFPIVEQLLEERPGQIRFAFRHFPLMKMHPHAKSAAEAAEAAGAQGKFWEMHELLFSHQDELEPANLFQYAQQLELDLDQVQQELTQHVHAKRVTDDLAGGIRSGVNGTPSFFINGVRHNGGYDLVTLLAAIDRALGGYGNDVDAH